MTAELAVRDNVTDLAARQPEPAADLTAIERVIVVGDLSKLSAEERWDYYRGVCRSLGLNPFTRPFDYINLSGKLTLYAKKDCADQLRKLQGVSVDITARERIDDLYVVTARATTREGRHDEEIGAVTIGNLRGDSLANALMKATTKAKRRVTLSICGLGMLDETELETIPSAKPANVETIPQTALPAPTAPPPTIAPEPADEVVRAKFEANWVKGTARAIACGVAPEDKPGPDATARELNKAQRELLDAIVAREKLNAELVARIAEVRAAGGEVADVDPATCTSTEVHEMLATLADMLAVAPDDEAF